MRRLQHDCNDDVPIKPIEVTTGKVRNKHDKPGVREMQMISSSREHDRYGTQYILWSLDFIHIHYALYTVHQSFPRARLTGAQCNIIIIHSQRDDVKNKIKK